MLKALILMYRCTSGKPTTPLTSRTHKSVILDLDALVTSATFTSSLQARVPRCFFAFVSLEFVPCLYLSARICVVWCVGEAKLWWHLGYYTWTYDPNTGRPTRTPPTLIADCGDSIKCQECVSEAFKADVILDPETAGIVDIIVRKHGRGYVKEFPPVLRPE